MATNTNLINNKNSYISFDATSINQLIIEKLNSSQIFTDQNFQGSNLSSLMDVISYTFSMLLYYLNKTSSETMFSEAQIYENMNRIVKLLNYNPKGKTSQNVKFTLNASLSSDNYMVPRYSNIKVGSLFFSFPKDIYFTYLADSTLAMQNPEMDLFLYEGLFYEYPTYSALGSINEVIFLNLGEETYIDHNNIYVYVKEVNTNTWKEWERCENLFLKKSTDNAFEVRYNPNKNYEIKFGDNINGKQLNTGDTIIIYYLKIDPNSSQIASNTLSKSKIVTYNSNSYSNILKDTVKNESIILNSYNISSITLNNDFPSTPYTPEETVDDIRKNAPKNFSYQQRLVTANDFENYIISNYSNIFSDCKVVGNEDYLKGHIKYLYDIGIKSPQLDNSILYNQIKFSNSCNFNNIYAYIVPKNGSEKYISSAQKEILINDLQDQKVITSEIIPMDPIYMLFDFYAKSPYTDSTINDINESVLLIYKKNNARQSNLGIINDVMKIIKNAFSKNLVKLSYDIDINQISSDIINLDGVDKIKTYRSDTDTYIDGLSLLCWNKTYPNLDVKVHNFNFKLDYFQYAAFNDIENLIKRIKIIDSGNTISVTDY
jgi:hypothetical protein